HATALVARISIDDSSTMGDGEATMTRSKFACDGGATTTILPHVAGHKWTKDGTPLCVDCERGIGRVATDYDLTLRVIQRVSSSDEYAHRAGARWAQGWED